MPSAPRDCARELVRIVRLAEEGAGNVGAHLADHADELAPLLRLAPEALRKASALSDEVLIADIGPRLQRAMAGGVEQEARRRDALTRDAAVQLAESVVWRDGVAHVDPGLLLGDVLAARTRHLVFVWDEYEVAIRRDVLLRARTAVKMFLDVESSVGRDGVQIHWRGGKGRLHFYPQPLEPLDRERATVIPLHPPVRDVRPMRPPRQRPSFLGEVLAELGYF